MTFAAPSRPLAVVLLSLALTAGCSRDPVATARQYTESGDAYAAQGRHKEAIIEYRNALKATPSAADVRYKLGRVYQDSGDPVNAYAELARAADLDPSNVDAQMRAGTLLLVAREFEAARTRAELALKADPNHAPAHILLGNAMAGLNEVSPALRQIEQAISLDPAYAPAWTALGAVTFLSGKRSEAAAAFQKAVELAPRSIDARLALANYQWASGATADAESTLKAALALDGGSTSAHRALALLYVTTRRAAEAEPHFRALATDSAGRLALADYYMGLGRNTDALGTLDEIERTGERADVRSAKLRRASIHYTTGRKADGHRILDELLTERPRYAEARTAKARMLLSEGAAGEALVQAREAVKADASLASAQYTLGLAAIAQRDFTEAERAFAEAARLSPRAAAAQMQLARIRLARGQAAGAVSAAESAARERPADPEAAVLLAQTLRAQGNVDRAARELTRRIADQPAAAPLHVEMGWLSLHRKQPAAARASFHEALRRDPASIEARHGIIAAHIAEKKIDSARLQAQEWVKSAPANPGMRVLAARVELAAGDSAAAERLLTAVIAADPSQIEAYELLGRTYVAQGRADLAVQQYDAIARRSPDKAVGARTMVGMLHEARNDRAAARTAYEEALTLDSKAGVAANNLAWMYIQDGKLEEALRLAEVARDALRLRPEAEDTLGWVYLQKGLATQAIASFTRARERAPQNPVYHYHLGLAYLRNGETDRAREALTRALELGTDFTGAEDARTKLEALADAKGDAPA